MNLSLPRFDIPKDLSTLVGPAAGAIATIISLIGIVLGIISATSVGDQLSSTAGLVHETSQKAADIQEAPELNNEHPIKWTGYQRLEDGKKIRVFFPSGEPKCYGYRTQVSESATSVAIKVTEGSLPGAPQDCTLIGATSSLVVELKAPLGARTLRN
ncbi:hypothetical protein G7Y31_07285 [Corynebacterium lizhenjunii]|uniref:Uncharacterized protein n=1 Tax=Corynebacterium lizhenjunii TaxID=2709394 RepID=A0A7T0P9W5_9CORY|nr:hypothetical protein [Corynebacterium lizhenjunii]QPK78376.1 hypothetical protein G7Y31_07285 [Corynebacterium lizhenjunii]